MNSLQIIENLGFFAIGTVTLSAMIGFLAKSIFNNYLNKNVESFKFQLQQENERFKSELQRENLEFQIKFSALHKDRAVIIKELHGLFILVRQELKNFNKNEELQKLPAALNPVLKKFEELHNYFYSNKLYFSKMLCNKVEDFLNRFLASAAISEFLSKNRDKYKIARKNDPSQRELDQTELFDMLKDSEVLNDLEDEFRKIIGFDNSNAANIGLPKA